MSGRQRRRRGLSKARSQELHARQRFRERHGLEVSRADLDRIGALIRSGKSTVVERQSNRVVVHDVEYEGRTRRVVYDRHRKTIVTVLPHDEDAA